MREHLGVIGVRGSEDLRKGCAAPGRDVKGENWGDVFPPEAPLEV